LKGPGAQGQVEAAVAVEELEHQTHCAHTSDADPDPDARVVRGALTIDGRRDTDQGQDHRRGKGDTRHRDGAGHGGSGHESRKVDRRSGRVHGRSHLPRPAGFVVALLTLAALVPACVPPDTPPRLDTRLPAAVFEIVQPDTVRTERIAPGVLYRYLWSPLGPWAVHLVESALDQRCDVVLDVLQAEPRETGGEGRELVTSMVERVGPAVLAAVNADFFTPEGRTVGAEVVDGRVTAARARPALAWKPGEPPWIGVPSVQGAWIDVGWPISIEGGDGQTQAVGGFPELLDQGERVGDLEVRERVAFAASRQPRTAVAYAPERGLLWLVVVDGRQPPHSNGMTLPELASLFEALGATEALNLDGGGSSVMVLGGRAINSPSDADGERAVVNALAIRRDQAACEAAK